MSNETQPDDTGWPKGLLQFAELLEPRLVRRYVDALEIEGNTSHLLALAEHLAIHARMSTPPVAAPVYQPYIIGRLVKVGPDDSDWRLISSAELARTFVGPPVAPYVATAREHETLAAMSEQAAAPELEAQLAALNDAHDMSTRHDMKVQYDRVRALAAIHGRQRIKATERELDGLILFHMRSGKYVFQGYPGYLEDPQGSGQYNFKRHPHAPIDPQPIPRGFWENALVNIRAGLIGDRSGQVCWSGVTAQPIDFDAARHAPAAKAQPKASGRNKVNSALEFLRVPDNTAKWTSIKDLWTRYINKVGSIDPKTFSDAFHIWKEENSIKKE